MCILTMLDLPVFRFNKTEIRVPDSISSKFILDSLGKHLKTLGIMS